MNYSKATLLASPVFRHFDELCHIPHVSGNEKALSDHILAWAMERGLQAKQDAHHNLYIRKPASKGYENAPSVPAAAISPAGAISRAAVHLILPTSPLSGSSRAIPLRPAAKRRSVPTMAQVLP